MENSCKCLRMSLYECHVHSLCKLYRCSLFSEKKKQKLLNNLISASDGLILIIPSIKKSDSRLKLTTNSVNYKIKIICKPNFIQIVINWCYKSRITFDRTKSNSVEKRGKNYT